MIPNQIGRPALGNAFARVFGVDDPQAVTSVAPEVLPTTSIWERPEFWALLGGNLCSMRTEHVAGGAGTFGYIALYLPANAGVLSIVETVVTEGVPAQLLVGTSSITGADGAGTPVHRDLRRTAGTAASFTNGINTRGAIGLSSGGVLLGYMPANQLLDVNLVLPPDSSFIVQSQTANVLFGATIIFRERPVTPQELKL